MTRVTRGSAALGVVMVLLAGASDRTHAATLVGETFVPDVNCTGARTRLQIGSLSDQYVVPAPGVVTRWSFQAGAAPLTLSLKVFRRAGGSDYVVVGDTPVEAPLPNQLNTFTNVRIPVAAGDLIGQFTALAGDCSRSASSVYVLAGNNGNPTVSSTFTTGFTIPSLQLDLSAVVEPDCDGDGLGDETQDASADCAPPDTTITEGPKAKTRRKRATFEFSGTDARAVAGFECSLDGGPFAACTSAHTVKVKKGKHTFSVRATDAAGNADASPATDDWKVKKKRR